MARFSEAQWSTLKMLGRMSLPQGTPVTPWDLAVETLLTLSGQHRCLDALTTMAMVTPVSVDPQELDDDCLAYVLTPRGVQVLANRLPVKKTRRTKGQP